MVATCLPALLEIGHRGGEETHAAWLGALGEPGGAQRADDGRATHVELPGHMSCGEALCVEGSGLLVARKPAYAPFRSRQLVGGRAPERARLDGRREPDSRLARGQPGGQTVMEPIQQPFEGLPQVAAQVPPVEDGLGLWRAQGGAACRRRRAVTAEDGRRWPGRRRQLADEPPQGIWAGGHMARGA
jgi:hypothetical protein